MFFANTFFLLLLKNVHKQSPRERFPIMMNNAVTKQASKNTFIACEILFTN